MRKYLSSLSLLAILISTNSYATTWDEPWADQVIKGASSFILSKVVSCDQEKGIKIVVLKTLSGKELKDTILISDFYLLSICSSSDGHGADFHTRPIDSCYFFVKQNALGQFCIATPTTGFDYVHEGQVFATFRHSYHQASVPVSVYERTMTAVFNNYHNLPYDKVYIVKFVLENLSKAAASFSDEEINTFFLQHVALECVYHLKLDIKESLVLPFLNDKNNFHSQVSGARAMRAFNTQTSKRELLKVVEDTARRNFVRVMCVWSLSDLHPTELKASLEKIVKSISDKTDDFGGNIMDPRICTDIPSPRKAVAALIEELK